MDPDRPRPPAARRPRAPRSPGSTSKRTNASNNNNNRQLGRPALESPPLTPLTTTAPTTIPRTNPLHQHGNDPGVGPAALTAVVKRESIPELDRLAAAAAAVSAGGTTSPFSTDHSFARPRTGQFNAAVPHPSPHQHQYRNSSAGLVGWTDRHPSYQPNDERSPRTLNDHNPSSSTYAYEPLAHHPNSASTMTTTTTNMTAGPSSSRLSVSNAGRGRRRSGHSNAIIDIDPIILRERERMENERMQRELAVDRDRRVAAHNHNNNNGPPPPHYSHQTLPAARPLSNDLAHLGSNGNVDVNVNNAGPLPPLPAFPFGPPSAAAAAPGRVPLDTFPIDSSLRRRSSASLEREPRRRTSSNPNPFLTQHHRLPTTSAAPIASNPNANNANSNAGPSSAVATGPPPPPPPLNAYPPGNQPSVMALPPGSGARIVDGPPGPNSGGGPPPGTVLIPSGGPGGPSVAGHHPHQVQSSIHPAHDNVGHDKMIILLGEVRSEYEAMQTDCMVLKGQRDEYENKSESFRSGGGLVGKRGSRKAHSEGRTSCCYFCSQSADSGDCLDQAKSLRVGSSACQD